MRQTLLDTDVLSEILKGIHPRIAANANVYLLQWSHFSLSVITLMEIAKGLHKVQRQDRLNQILSELAAHEIIDLNQQAAVLAGRIYADLERTGQPIGRADPMIAATALHRNLALATGNQTHYQRIIELGYPLELEDWKA